MESAKKRVNTQLDNYESEYGQQHLNKSVDRSTVWRQIDFKAFISNYQKESNLRMSH